jgi:hypothetical protein
MFSRQRNLRLAKGRSLLQKRTRPQPLTLTRSINIQELPSNHTEPKQVVAQSRPNFKTYNDPEFLQHVSDKFSLNHSDLNVMNEGELDKHRHFVNQVFAQEREEGLPSPKQIDKNEV